MKAGEAKDWTFVALVLLLVWVAYYVVTKIGAGAGAIGDYAKEAAAALKAPFTAAKKTLTGLGVYGPEGEETENLQGSVSVATTTAQGLALANQGGLFDPGYQAGYSTGGDVGGTLGDSSTLVPVE